MDNINRAYRTFSVTITYDTPPYKINRAVSILQEILAVPKEPEGKEKHRPHPNEAINQQDFPPRVYFNEFNADSLNIYISYWYHPPKWWNYMEHAHQINVQIKERFNAEGIEFAFPTQTVHLADDSSQSSTIDQEQTSEEESS